MSLLIFCLFDISIINKNVLKSSTIMIYLFLPVAIFNFCFIFLRLYKMNAILQLSYLIGELNFLSLYVDPLYL